MILIPGVTPEPETDPYEPPSGEWGDLINDMDGYKDFSRSPAYACTHKESGTRISAITLSMFKLRLAEFEADYYSASDPDPWEL